MEELKKRLKELEVLIKDAKDRLPAHSVKTPNMMQLLDLEDEYSEVLKKIKAEDFGKK